MKTLILFLGITLYSYISYGQNQDIRFVVNNIEQNYPGLTKKSDKSKFETYVKHLLLSNKERDTFWKLSMIVNYFHNKHLLVCDTSFMSNINKQKLKLNLSKAIDYLSKKHLVEYEGYWLNDYKNCVLGIIQTSTKPLIYKGYVVETRNDNILVPGMLCCEFVEQKNGSFYTKYTSNTAKYQIYITSNFRNDSVITTGSFGKWKKIKNYKHNYLKNITPYNNDASFKKINNNCFLITLPEDSRHNTLIVDSLVKENRTQIENSETLIIDIRNNNGGTVQAYYPILPFIYTRPIKTVGGYDYCSPLGIKNEENMLSEYMKRPILDTSIINILKTRISEMKIKEGGFLLIKGDTIKLDSVKSHPKDVAIIVNYGCMSAAELMLLDFKQSSKVRIFGEPTGGAVDYLNFYPIISPSKKYWLYIPNTIRILSKTQPSFDNRGIIPDIKISDTTKDWVKFVQSYYYQ